MITVIALSVILNSNTVQDIAQWEAKPQSVAIAISRCREMEVTTPDSHCYLLTSDNSKLYYADLTSGDM